MKKFRERGFIFLVGFLMLTVSGCATDADKVADGVTMLINQSCFDDGEKSVLSMAVFPASRYHYWRVPYWEKCNDSLGKDFYRWQSRQTTQKEAQERMINALASINRSEERKDQIVKLILENEPEENYREYYLRLYRNLK